MPSLREKYLPAGLCTGTEQATFAAVDAGDEQRIAEAQALCRRCPVLDECYKGMADAIVIGRRRWGRTVVASIDLQRGRYPPSSRLSSEQLKEPIDVLEAMRAEGGVRTGFGIFDVHESRLIEELTNEVIEVMPARVARFGRLESRRMMYGLFMGIRELVGSDGAAAMFRDLAFGTRLVELVLHDAAELSIVEGAPLYKALVTPKNRQLKNVKSAMVKEFRAKREQMRTPTGPNLLELAPPEVLGELRRAIAAHSLSLRSPHADVHDPAVKALFAELAPTYGNSPQTMHAISLFTRAFARHTQFFGGRRRAQPLTAKQLREPLAYFLEEFAEFRRECVPRPHFRALYSSLSDLLAIERYWVNERGMSGAMFKNILELSIIDADAFAGKYSSWYGARAELEQGDQGVRSYHETIGGGDLALEGLIGDVAPGPAELLIDGEDRTARKAQLEELLGHVSEDEAAAVAVAYELQINNADEIDIPQLCGRLGVAAEELNLYVERQIIPKLAALAVRQ